MRITFKSLGSFKNTQGQAFKPFLLGISIKKGMLLSSYVALCCDYSTKLGFNGSKSNKTLTSND